MLVLTFVISLMMGSGIAAIWGGSAVVTFSLLTKDQPRHDLVTQRLYWLNPRDKSFSSKADPRATTGRREKATSFGRRNC